MPSSLKIPPQMVGMVMAVDAVEHLDAHAEEAGSFPLVDARLHEPGRSRVPQRVWVYLALQFCEPHGGFECGGGVCN